MKQVRGQAADQDKILNLKVDALKQMLVVERIRRSIMSANQSLVMKAPKPPIITIPNMQSFNQN